MRRKHLLIEDKKLITDFLNSEEYGCLSIIDRNIPYIVPLNFCYYKDQICFHGAMDGRKASILKLNPPASFSVSKPYSYIPSYFYGEKPQTPTQFFASVYIEGNASIIEDIEKKADILDVLTRKYENESNFSVRDGFLNMTKNTLVAVIDIHNITAKFKFGQDLSERNINIILENLKKRYLPIDIETINMINTLYKMR